MPRKVPFGKSRKVEAKEDLRTSEANPRVRTDLSRDTDPQGAVETTVHVVPQGHHGTADRGPINIEWPTKELRTTIPRKGTRVSNKNKGARTVTMRNPNRPWMRPRLSHRPTRKSPGGWPERANGQANNKTRKHSY